MVAERLAHSGAKLTQRQRAKMHLSRSLILSVGRRGRCRAGRPYLTDSKAVIAQTQGGKRSGYRPDFGAPGGLRLSRGVAIGVRLMQPVELQHRAEIGASGDARRI